jgi:hypothetical protein
LGTNDELEHIAIQLIAKGYKQVARRHLLGPKQYYMGFDAPTGNRCIIIWTPDEVEPGGRDY